MTDAKKYSSAFVILGEAGYINPSAFNFTPLPSPPPWGGNNDLVILSKAKYINLEPFRLTPHPYPLP